MTIIRSTSAFIATTLAIFGSPSFAQLSTPKTYTLPAKSAISAVTLAPLSSKTSAKGDIVAMRTAADIAVDGHVVIPRGSAVTGQISEARARGGLGMSGKLAIRLLYIRLGDRYIRFNGGAVQNSITTPDTVAGLLFISPVISGRSATIAAGTALTGYTTQSVELSEWRPAETTATPEPPRKSP